MEEWESEGDKELVGQAVAVDREYACGQEYDLPLR